MAPTPSASVVSVKPAFTGCRRYVGTVGKSPVVVELMISDSSNSCTGSYYYRHRGESLALQAVHFRPNQPVSLRETVDGVPTGSWQATQTIGPTLTGTWQSANGSRRLPFALQEDYTDAVRYEIRAYKATDEACDAIGRQDTSSISVEYIVFTSDGPLRSTKPEEAMQADLDDCAASESHIEVGLNDHCLFSYKEYSEIFYYGTAHPNHSISTTTYDLHTGRALQLSDLLWPGYEKPLRQLLTTVLLTDPGYEGADWHWLENKEDTLQLAPLPGSGFLVTPTGIHFQYSDYEICAYVIGMPEVVIPYSRLRALIRTDGPLASLLQSSKR